MRVQFVIGTGERKTNEFGESGEAADTSWGTLDDLATHVDEDAAVLWDRDCGTLEVGDGLRFVRAGGTWRAFHLGHGNSLAQWYDDQDGKRWSRLVTKPKETLDEIVTRALERPGATDVTSEIVESPFGDGIMMYKHRVDELLDRDPVLRMEAEHASLMRAVDVVALDFDREAEAAFLGALFPNGYDEADILSLLQ